jgi:speckle-type POZ protein
MASRKKAAKTDSKIGPSITVPRYYWCQSKAEVDEVRFKWTIERFGFIGDGEDFSTSISTSDEFDGKFRLCLIGEEEEVRINLVSNTTVIGYTMRVETAIVETKCRKFIGQKETIVANTQFPVTVFTVGKKLLLGLVNFMDEEMTILCEISIFKRKQEPVKVIGREIFFGVKAISNNYQDLILHQLQEMFEKMPLSDVTFNIRGRKFSAHKAILAMRSPVLSAMFHHPTKEALSSKVNVDDIDPDVFQEVLCFIYTGKTQSTAMDKMAPGILAAADKYLLEDLKSWCETHLIRQMSAENCLELLSLTIHHPAEHLKKYAIDYFRRHPGKSRLNKCLTIMIPCSFDD